MDLSSFCEEEIFLSAMRVELDKKEFYRKLANDVTNTFLKDKLNFLADEEERHQLFLEETYWNWFAGKDVELPEKTFVPLPELKLPPENIHLSKIVDSIMIAELAVQDFYNSFAEMIENDIELKNMLKYFANMELQHYKILELEKESIQNFEEIDDSWL